MVTARNETSIESRLKCFILFYPLFANIDIEVVTSCRLYFLPTTLKQLIQLLWISPLPLRFGRDKVRRSNR